MLFRSSEERRACTLQRLSVNERGVGREDLFAALRDHNGFTPKQGWRRQMPCAHSSWWPTRRSGQTTGSMVSRVSASDSLHYLTGTSAPCLSVFKPVILGRDNNLGDTETLFWQHERLQRLVVGDYARRRAVFEEARVTLQVAALSSSDPWDAHQQQIREWTSRVERMARSRNPFSLFDRYWAEQDKLDQVFLGKLGASER